MVGTTLDDIRQYVESIADESGEYALVCARTGDQPVPSIGLRFETRSCARAAAHATEQYRATLRRYDPQVPYYDVIATQIDSSTVSHGSSRFTSSEESMIDFCHTVAGALFEAIAASGYGLMEAAIMDTYFHLAETTASPDTLCVHLIESMATEIEVGLDEPAQLELLQSAANRLPEQSADGDPLEATLKRLQSVAAVGEYTLKRCPDGTSMSWFVTVEEYAFSESDERVITLPITLDLLRQPSCRILSIPAVERMVNDSTWRLTVTAALTDSPEGLVCASGGGQ